MDDSNILVQAVEQNTFPGQLQIIRALVAAGAPSLQAEIIANSRFENLWSLIVGKEVEA